MSRLKPEKILLLLICFLFSASAYSQGVKIILVDEQGKELPPDTSKWMPAYHVSILKSMKLIYRTPFLFEEIPGVECFKDNGKLEYIITCAGNQLRSKNEDFLAFILVYPRPDSAKIQSYFSGNPKAADQMYAGQIRAKILQSLGKNASIHGPNANFNWEEYVHYYPPEEAKLKFNADNAVSFPIHLIPKDYYKGKYKYLKALFLEKNGRGFINFYCFYTERGKKDLDKYWKAIESIFRYED